MAEDIDRLVNTITSSLNTALRPMTEMSQATGTKMCSQWKKNKMEKNQA